jgi:hypothetical protein
VRFLIVQDPRFSSLKHHKISKCTFFRSLFRRGQVQCWFQIDSVRTFDCQLPFESGLHEIGVTPSTTFWSDPDMSGGSAPGSALKI